MLDFGSCCDSRRFFRYLSEVFLPPRVSNLNACTRNVTEPTSHPEEATQGSLLKAAVERDGSYRQTEYLALTRAYGVSS